MKTLKDLGDVRGKRIFVRCDFNVPMTDGKIDDDYRIRMALPTIGSLREKGAKLVLASHIESEGESTLRPVHEYLSKLFSVEFAENFFPESVDAGALPEGGVILLENLRKYPGEKANDEGFAKHLASFADLYVNDAFATCHRKHASMVGIPKLIPGYAGYLVENEVSHLSAAFEPSHPFAFILGGAKFDTKLPLVKKFLGLADSVFVGGALGNDVLKARGANVGKSLLSEGADVSEVAASQKVMLPVDVKVRSGGGTEVKKIGELSDVDEIVDCGPETVAVLAGLVGNSKFILWNGPLGVFEEGFREGTDALAKTIADSGSQAVVGGGDTLSSIASLGVEEKFWFVSTAGGAMLDFLANGTLPAVEELG